MKRIALFLSAIVLAACSSGSSAPKDVFTGTWTGAVNGTTITANTTQSGTSVTGTGTAVGTSVNLTAVVTGTSSAPNLNLTMVFSDSEVLTYTGTYANADSVAGIFVENSDTVAFSFKKQ